MRKTAFQAACEALWGPYYVSEAARELGVGRRTVQRYFNGERDIPHELVERLAELLKQRRDRIEKLLQPIEKEIA